ncbi:MAG: helix-turn-helix domain containing protein [Deltaproteobacteria bacterium]|nr:helix-turn-helix domain containing protein [Deltaproteobacteria bacterium]
MMTLIEIAKALKKEFKCKNFIGVANLIGITPESLRSAKTRNLIPFEKLLKLCEKENKSADWVFFGRGEPDEPGFGSATPEEKELLNKILKIHRNPATKAAIETTANAMVKVPAPDAETE